MTYAEASVMQSSLILTDVHISGNPNTLIFWARGKEYIEKLEQEYFFFSNLFIWSESNYGPEYECI